MMKTLRILLQNLFKFPFLFLASFTIITSIKSTRTHSHALVAALAPNSFPIQIVYDSSNSQHRDINYHPEQPSRINACIDLLESYNNNSNGNINNIKEEKISSKNQHEHHLELKDISLINTTNKQQQQSSDTETGADTDSTSSFEFLQVLSKARLVLTEIHTEELVSSIEMKCHKSRERRIEEGKPPLGFIGNLDHDTFLTTESYDVCLRATAIWMYCVEKVMNGLLLPLSSSPSSSASAFTSSMALTRPPGHHATKTLSNGFCIFNFAAAAAVHALSLPNCHKVSILDWDVHYGQGVADIIKDYPNIRYVSMHQMDAFPYMYQCKTKSVSGKYKNIKTVPIQPDSSWTCGFQSAFMEDVLPFCYSEGEWEADLVIVCAGYDALDSDELASCSLNAKDYGTMTRLLRERIGHYGNTDTGTGTDTGKKNHNVGLMFGLEGGYQLRENVPGGNLADAVLETIKAATSTNTNTNTSLAM